jgi:hypothetical protein
LNQREGAEQASVEKWFQRQKASADWKIQSVPVRLFLASWTLEMKTSSKKQIGERHVSTKMNQTEDDVEHRYLDRRR